MSASDREGTVAGYLAARPSYEDLVSICELAALVCEAPSAHVTLVAGDRECTVASYGDVGAHELGDLAGPGTARALADAGEDVYREEPIDPAPPAGDPSGRGRAPVRLYAAAVLRAPSGVAVGTLSVVDIRPGRLLERRQNTVDRRRRMLATLARQVIGALELGVRTEELARSNAELARSQQQLAAFAGQISHDLKNPLAATLAFIELLGDVDVVSGDPVARQYAARSLASGRRMLTMIDDLLGYARLGGTLHRRPVRLDDVLPAVLQDLGDLASAGSVRWTGDAIIHAAPAQLRALLQNLLSNALVYTRDGVPAEVSVTAQPAPDGAVLIVADNGTGIPPEKRAEVLLPLVRLRTDVHGTGLGLATCQRIVAGHGGTLEIGETPGGGTTIRIVLPQ